MRVPIEAPNSKITVFVIIRIEIILGSHTLLGFYHGVVFIMVNILPQAVTHVNTPIKYDTQSYFDLF